LIQTGGAGGTDCSIVTDPCNMDYIGLFLYNCTQGNVFQLDRQIVFSNNPGGNLIVEVTDGTNFYTQTITGHHH
jgi:hypothetical protein